MHLYLIRHGQTDWNLNLLAMGQKDIPLNPTGHAQAEALAQYLGPQCPAPARIVSSDLLRARQTAQALAQVLKVPVATDARLREIHLGDFEGTRLEERQQRYPELVEQLNQDPWSVRPPGGESREELVTRVAESWQHWSRRFEEGSLLMVCHGGTLHALISVILEEDLGRPPRTYHRIFRFGNASITTLSRDRQRWRIDSTNQRHFLSPHLL